MSDTTQYPFDTDHLIKGSTVTVAEIERAYSVKHGTDGYQFAWLKAREFVIKRFAERGEVVTITQREGALVILTDEEQAPYNAGQFDIHDRGMRRSHTRMLGADRSKITNPDTLALHDRRIEVQGRILAAASRERKTLPPTPHQRSTPVLPGARKPDDEP